VIGACFTVTYAEFSPLLNLSRALSAGAYESTLQANTIWFNDTDYNLTAALELPDLGSVAASLTPRIIIEYGDRAIQQSMQVPSSLPPVFPTRIIIEYADDSFQMGLQRHEIILDQTIASRIIVEYVDYASTTRSMIPGDLNGDWKVSIQDLVILANAYGSQYEMDHNGHVWNLKADIDGNGAVGLSDLVILAQHYGQHYP
jgi:hypothetical protein